MLPNSPDERTTKKGPTEPTIKKQVPNINEKNAG